MGTRENILDAADQLFGEFGFDGATTRQIAEMSGANKALIHYHFRGKAALFAAVLDRYYASLSMVLTEAITEGGSTVRSRVHTVVDTYLDFLRDNLAFSHMVQREAAGGRHVERIVAHMTPLFRGGSALLGGILGELSDDPAEPLSAPQLLISFYGMIISYFTYAPVLEPLLGYDPLSEEGLAARKQHLTQMVEITLAALQGHNTHNDVG